MLSSIISTAHAQGWLDPSKTMDRSIYLSRGASMWMIFSLDGRPSVFLKFSHLMDLEPEALRYRDAHAAFPEHAPHYLGHSQRDGVSILATRAVTFKAVTKDTLAQRGQAMLVRKGLEEFFRSASGSSFDADGLQVRSSIDLLRRHYERHALAEIALPALDQAAPILLGLPAIAQHGDLVINNLGLRPDGNLVVFDWEDYKSLWLPGLDLFTLTYSFSRAVGTPYDPRGIEHYLPKVAVQKALGVDQSLMHQLRLVHALGFLFLKRVYGPEIQTDLTRMISELAH